MRRVPHLLAALAVAALISTTSALGRAWVGPEQGAPAQAPDAVISVDATQRAQTIDGFGVNINGAAWNGGELQPALDMLSDQLGATIWRVILEESDWEAANDNADPQSFNWPAYRAIYQSAKFESLWSTLEYVSAKPGAVVLLDVMGRLPQWMGRTAIAPADEDEWVEMIASLLYYAQAERGITIPLLSPANETDMGSPEGPLVAPDQYARLLKKLIARLDALGLDAVGIVPPDVTQIWQATNYFGPILADPAIMARVQQFSLHNYSGDTGNGPQLIADSAYPDRGLWMTEFSALCVGCDSGQRPADPQSFATQTFDYLLRHLDAGVTGAIVYDGFETYYIHHGADSYWGLLSHDAAAGTYSPTRRLPVLAHVYRFVRPGAVYVAADTADQRLTVAAFVHPTTGAVTVVGRNSSDAALLVRVQLGGISATKPYQVYQTTDTAELQRGADVSASGGALLVTVAPNAIFTIHEPGQAPPPTATPKPTPIRTPQGYLPLVRR